MLITYSKTHPVLKYTPVFELPEMKKKKVCLRIDHTRYILFREVVPENFQFFYNIGGLFLFQS